MHGNKDFFMKKKGRYLFLLVSAWEEKSSLVYYYWSILSLLKLDSLVIWIILAPQVEGLAPTSQIWLLETEDDKLSFCPMLLIYW